MRTRRIGHGRRRVRALPGDSSRTSSGVNAAGFVARADDVFGRIADRYDVLCDVFSLGIHRLWKRRVARVIAEARWSVLLDGASGTGDIVLRVLSRQRMAGRAVIAADLSDAMLAVAARRLGTKAGQVSLRRLDAEAMPAIEDASVDAYSMSLVMKICDRKQKGVRDISRGFPSLATHESRQSRGTS